MREHIGKYTFSAAAGGQRAAAESSLLHKNSFIPWGMSPVDY